MTALLVALALAGANGHEQDTFQIHASAPRVAAWLAVHNRDVIAATGAKILWERGNQSCILKPTPKGDLWIVLQHDVHGLAYECKMLKASPQVKSYRLTGHLFPVGSNVSTIAVDIDCVIDIRMARDEIINRNLRKGLDSVRILIQRAFP